MAIKRFVEAAGKKGKYGYNGIDRIPGTDKVITYCATPQVYSSESSLERITTSEYVNVEQKVKRKTYPGFVR